MASSLTSQPQSASYQSAGVPVLWTAVEYGPGLAMADAGLFWAKPKSLRGGGEVVVKKKYASAFFGTALASDLRVLGVDTVVLCGVSMLGCVRASALDTMQNGFRPIVVGAACGDRGEEIQNANLFDLDAKYADVVTEEEAIEHLREGWPKV
ncbi:uncharacterized protein PG998_006476 [Apiospora kogelbergensis]|uniref:uncharacterized protein n=1 Tax=Apiospora kogelbergensis TaxID=1337665 RepID=UPI003130418B